MTLLWIILFVLAFAGAIFAVVLAVLEHWIAFFLFLVVYVIGVAALSTLAVTT